LREGWRRHPFLGNGVFTEFSKKDIAESPTAFSKKAIYAVRFAFFENGGTPKLSVVLNDFCQ
jgi:hypothetical protein